MKNFTRYFLESNYNDDVMLYGVHWMLSVRVHCILHCYIVYETSDLCLFITIVCFVPIDLPRKFRQEYLCNHGISRGSNSSLRQTSSGHLLFTRLHEIWSTRTVNPHSVTEPARLLGELKKDQQSHSVSYGVSFVTIGASFQKLATEIQSHFLTYLH